MDMTQAEISGISPLFIVSHVPSSLSFYRDRLGFERNRLFLFAEYLDLFSRTE
jgi:catechol 2,3-dioxygenase-like lactoylglutathione lyase family enzyme